MRHFEVLVLLSLSGCGKDCDVPVDRCDTDECVVLIEEKLQSDGCMRREAAACAEQDVGGDDVATRSYRTEDDTCWVFHNSFLPAGFEHIDESHPCAERLAEVQMCRE